MIFKLTKKNQQGELCNLAYMQIVKHIKYAASCIHACHNFVCTKLECEITSHDGMFDLTNSNFLNYIKVSRISTAMGYGHHQFLYRHILSRDREDRKSRPYTSSCSSSSSFFNKLKSVFIDYAFRASCDFKVPNSSLLTSTLRDFSL